MRESIAKYKMFGLTYHLSPKVYDFFGQIVFLIWNLLLHNGFW